MTRPVARSTHFRKQVDAFLKRSGVAPTTFGKQLFGDPNFIKDLRNGRRPNVDACDKVLTFISKHDRDSMSGVR